MISVMFFNSLISFHKISCVHYCTKAATKNKLYSNTIFLPKTKFPLRLENKKLVDRDETIHNVAEFENLYLWQRSHLYEPEFVLHDGPPYANGQLHMGHAINKILKDTILRYHILQGTKVHYVPGWDCHGLPIELKAITDSNKLDTIEIRTKARNFAMKTVEDQKKVFKSWGVIGDWDNSYRTYTADYVKSQLHLFFKLYKKNLIFRDVKPIYWSPSSRTALAEAELEYNEKHKSPSAYVRLEMKSLPKLELLKDKLCTTYAIIWTTTPWTLPSNHAVCYNKELSYSLLRISDAKDSNIYLVASELVDSLSSTLNTKFEVVEVIPGDALEGATYVHPVYRSRLHRLVNASYATASKGTGLVHIAGAHGPDDFLIALDNKLPIVDLVNEIGCFKSEAGPELEGKFVLSDGNKTVLDIVKDNLMHVGEITHSYPYDWRTKKPVIIRASQQWFVDTNAIKNRAVELLENVNIIPNERCEIYKRNLINQIMKRPYWCISRQRKWGVPIPVLYNKSSSETIINENTMNHQCNLLETHGTDFWWTLSPRELLPENMCSNQDTIEKGQDIMDIWMDSGLSWGKVLEGTKVADLYLEGVDQFTGWFQSSLLTSVGLRDKAPYKTIYVHGFAVDKNGVKMSKSTGNVVDPLEITNGKKGQKPYGIDVLRWWVTCHANQVALANVSPTVLQASAEEVQKIRSILRFALGSLSDYVEIEENKKNLLLIDKYMLHLLYRFHERANESLKNYKFHQVSTLVMNLLSNPISALYYTAIKDRLYCESLDSTPRRSAQFVLLKMLEIVTLAVAPMVPHLAEEIYQHFPSRERKTFFTSSHPRPESFWEDEDVEKKMGVILDCKKVINKQLGASTSDAEVRLVFPKKVFENIENSMKIDELEKELVDIFQVARVSIVADDLQEYKLEISKSANFSCPRCRRVHSEKEDELCKRCSDVVNSLGINKSAVVN
ncbi:unnamed protein product [Phaedon cochleariae]|uniref:isoleucine--tRNA ligase n=1 Tax=Phaedon cochleariae TaxID=80249 RepID=A0A9P0DNW4_PHACE|nr:unnamed protein product [Phaedon cochleariae]